MVTVVAKELEGWRWWTGHGAYPKAAADCFRRAAWLLREVAPSGEVYQRLQRILQHGTTP
jgi:hypothetical protein